MMKDGQPKTIYLHDYRAPDFLIDKTDLSVELSELVTTVTSVLSIRRNPDVNNHSPLVLHGRELELVSIAIDGVTCPASDYQIDDERLTVTVPDQCQMTCITQIKPQENTSLEGLYKSSGMYCTQCEAEGFRKITYYLDRPDVMSEFTTTIIADKSNYPLLLSNGNLVAEGEYDNNLHWKKWHDPFKKPAYLFALVAGQLEHIEDIFVTASGRKVTLRIFVEPKDLDKCDYAMASLKRAMKWDEEVYGREYDLDIFMIVAVDDFNMGAMENKGLNIFNTSCVLANPSTTTDQGFQRVEGVVAHEYFHNWSGNRVTCRDWFQLSLKEGFTVFRDQMFSADMGSATVKRVEDVSVLRTLQFAEDAGPMAHPVQPASFIEISNFYTLTVYEKGAEIVRMLHTLLGEETFRTGSDLYFERHDGQAVTIDDFVRAMESASGRDLSQFKYWYTQAGTPTLLVSDQYDEHEKTYTLTFRQEQTDTPEAKAKEKQALHLPVVLGLVGDGGNLPLKPKNPDLLATLQESSDNTQVTLELNQQEQHFIFTDIHEKPVPSLLRNFSAPVKLSMNYTRADYLCLMSRDTDGFNRWNASQQLAVSIIHELVEAYQQKQDLVVDRSLSEGFFSVLSDPTLDKAMIALMLNLPSEAYLAEIATIVDVEAIHVARKTLRQHIAETLRDQFWLVYQQLNNIEDYQPTAEAIAKRSLKNSLLGYLMLLDEPSIHQACFYQYENANNMTDSFAALRALVHSDFSSLFETRESALASFYERWQSETLVVNQWLGVQATTPHADALSKVKQLMDHESFSIKNPNKVRSLIGSFCSNKISFHQSSGDGYRFLVDQVKTLNELNPQIAARLLTPLTSWKKYPVAQQTLMKESLEEILAIDKLSKDVYEVVIKSL